MKISELNFLLTGEAKEEFNFNNSRNNNVKISS